MLNKLDIEFMKDSQDEIYKLRERPISVIYFDKTYDVITGQPTGEAQVTLDTEAVVTETSSGDERYVTGGIEYESGDAKFDVKKDAVIQVIAKIERIEYDRQTYEILGSDAKGIGKRNRYEIIGRVIA